jgi:hypothetical protein
LATTENGEHGTFSHPQFIRVRLESRLPAIFVRAAMRAMVAAQFSCQILGTTPSEGLMNFSFLSAVKHMRELLLIWDNKKGRPHRRPSPQ